MLQVCSFTSLQRPYLFFLRLQEALVQLRQQGRVPDTLLVVQHKPVYTIGKRGTLEELLTSPEALASLGAEVVHIPRGGQVTWHGPGQLVGYPLVGLRALGLGARAYVEALEDGLVAAAGAYGVAARGRVPGKTGVWVGDRKMGAIGVRVTHGITSHGVALNVDPCLSWYRHIIPCGTPDKEVTSIAEELRRGRNIILQHGVPPPAAAAAAAAVPEELCRTSGSSSTGGAMATAGAPSTGRPSTSGDNLGSSPGHAAKATLAGHPHPAHQQQHDQQLQQGHTSSGAAGSGHDRQHSPMPSLSTGSDHQHQQRHQQQQQQDGGVALCRPPTPLALDLSVAKGVLVSSLARSLGHTSWQAVSPDQLMQAVGWADLEEQGA